MLVLEYVEKNYPLHPYILEVLEIEGMNNFFAWDGFSNEIRTLELCIQNHHSLYETKNTYDEKLQVFGIKLADQLILKKIEKDILSKGAEFFSIPKFTTVKDTIKDKYPLLDLMIQHFNKGSRAYDAELRRLALFLFLKCGPAVYEFLYNHFPLPSKTTVKYDLGAISNVVEGDLRVKEFQEHIEKYNLPKIVWISEDATRCEAKVEYDSKSDKFVGFDLPLNQNGLPDVNKFKNISPQKLVEAFKATSKSKYIYVVMAQPLQDACPPFCLTLFGTNNRFNYLDVRNRIETIKTKLEEVGVSVMGHSSDGDPRLLKYMKSTINLGISSGPDIPSQFEKFYFAKINTNVSTTQDTLHILTKLRRCLIKVDSTLVIGNHAISVAFLINLVNDRPRGEHNLVIGDLLVKDSMNVKSVLKLLVPEVSDLLNKYYQEETKALIMYLKLLRYIHDSFEDKTDTVSDRIKKMSYATFFLRIWKNTEDAYHFITVNTYTCIEINFHMLLDVYRKLRDLKLLKNFIPWRFSSQPCEEFFRTARSLTPSESTVINFTTHQFCHRVKRIQTLTDIKNHFGLIKEGQMLNVEYLTDEELVKLIDDGVAEAVNDFLTLGIVPDLEKHLKIGIKSKIRFKQEKDDVDTDEEITNDTDDDESIEMVEISDSDDTDDDFDDEIIDDCSGLAFEVSEDVAPQKGCFALKTSGGKTFQIKKGSFCYAFQDKDFVSTDRLYRFIPRNETQMELPCSEEDVQIRRDGWGIFKHFKYVCHILKMKEGRKNLNFVSQPVNQVVSVYCNFFSYQKNDAGQLMLKLATIKPQFLPSFEFLGHVPAPDHSQSGFVYTKLNDISLIENLLDSVE